MARKSGAASPQTFAAATSCTPSLTGLTWAANDFIYWVVTQDNNAATNITASAGWTEVGAGNQASVNNSRTAIFYKVAAGGDGAPTFSAGSNSGVWTVTVQIFKDVDTANPIEGWQRIDHTGVASKASNATAVSSSGGAGTQLSASADSLLVYAWARDAGRSMRCKASELTMLAPYLDQSSATNNQQLIGYRQATASGAPPTTTMYTMDTAVGGNGWVVALKNASGGSRQPQALPDMTEHIWFGSFSNMTPTLVAPSSLAATIDGITASATALSASAPQPDGRGTPYKYTPFASTEVASAWTGPAFSFASPIDLSAGVTSFEWKTNRSSASTQIDTKGVILAVSDGTNVSTYQIMPKSLIAANTWYAAQVACGNVTPTWNSGTAVTLSAVTKVAFLTHNANVSGGVTTDLKNFATTRKATVTGGGAAEPSTYATAIDSLASWGYSQVGASMLGDLQGAYQVLSKALVQVGDGSAYTHFKASPQSCSFPVAFNATDQRYWNVPANVVGVLIKPSSADTIDMGASIVATSLAQPFGIDAAGSSSCTHTFAGQSVVGCPVTLQPGFNYAGLTLSGGSVAAYGAAAGATTTFTFAILDAEVITLYPTANNQTFDFSGCDFAAAITLANGTAYTGTTFIKPTGSTVTDGGGTITITSPALTITFAGMVNGMTLKAFSAGTQTVLFSVSSSGTSEAWAGATGPFDYTIQKAGYRPLRGTSEAATATRTITVYPSVDRAYVASSGLTFDTNCFANPGTKLFGLTAVSTLQNFYSRMIESWITEATLQNKAFPITPNGPNSFTLGDGWDWNLATYPNSINLLSRDGMRLVDSGGTVTAMWAAVLSVGVPAGMQVRYQQQDGSGTTNALTTGNIDQLIQIYKTGAGAFDYTNWLVLKVQAEGYDQAEAVVLDIYPTLDDQLFVVALVPTPNGIAGASGITGITITSEPTPVTWNGQDFSTTITDTTDTHSGLQVMQYVRHLNDFNMHDMIRANGAKFKTVTGNVYGDALTTPAGVRVVKADGVTPHPDFDLFIADNSGTYTPPVLAPIEWAGAVAGTTCLLYNDSNAGAIIDTQTVTGAGGYVWTITLPHADVAAGDALRIRYGSKGHYAGELQGTMTANGLKFVGDMTAHPVYAGWGLDGADYDKANGGPFTMDGTNLQVDIAAAATSGTKVALGAWTQYLMTLPAGLDAFYGAWDLLALNQIRQNVAVVNVKIDVPTAGALFTFTDNNVNYYRSDFTFPGNVQAGHGLIAMTFNAEPFVATVTGGNVVTGTPATVAAAVRSELSAELAATVRAEKFARNKQVLDPATGQRTVFDNDGTTVLGQGGAYMDADGTIPYDGSGPVHCTDRLA